jgi:hypothetical protein
MPGWYIHLEVARRAAEILPRLQAGDLTSRTHHQAGAPSSFQGAGPTPQELADLIQKYPNYYALGAIGPDIFFFLPDFKGKPGNFIAQMAEWVISFYESLDEKVLGPWEDIVGPVEENTTEELSRLTGGLSDEISKIANLASGIMTNAVMDFASRLYDWFGVLGSGVAPAYDDKLFYWSDMFHYRRTNEFARDLFDKAAKFTYDAEGHVQPGRYEPGLAFALGWMTHIGTDVTGHAFVNEKSGGPYRLHWQRHHLVENHMDSFVYNNQRGSQERYNMEAMSALHFWLQFNKDNNYEPDYDFFDPLNPANPKHFPEYPLGNSARDYYDRKKAFDVDSEIPPALAYYLLDTMKKTFYDDHNPANNGGMPTHPMILAALTAGADGRPDLELMHTDFALLYKYIKYTSTDYYKMPKPTPPEVFPNIDPPLPPGSSDDAPGSSDDDWDFWKTLLAIFAWIKYLADWLAYIATILPALVADLGTYPARYVLYLIEEALYELWKAFRYLLVLEGFVMPEPDEIDLGLVQLGMPSQGPYQGLLATINDVFGGLLGDDPNPVPLSEPVRDRLYPRQSVRDDPTLIQSIVGFVEGIASPGCGLPEPDSKWFAEFLRPWEYPLKNNDHSNIGMEPAHTRASPHAVGQVPTALFGSMPGSDDARHQYEEAPTPAATDKLNESKLNEKWNLGDSLNYSLYVIGQLTREGVDPLAIASFNLDADRGYAYKTWDWDRHDKYIAKYNNDSHFSYPVPCTPPEQFSQDDICDTNTPHEIPLRYDFSHPMPLALHYLKLLKKGETYPGCKDDPAGTPPIK